MNPPPLSNYPRPDASIPEPFRVWRGDLIFGVIGILDLLPGAPKFLADSFAGRDGTTQMIMLGTFLVFCGLVVWLEVKVIYRWRWAMWLLLVLTLIGLAFGVSDGFADARKDTWDALSLLLEVVSVIYLPLRLFGKIGPRPR